MKGRIKYIGRKGVIVSGFFEVGVGEVKVGVDGLVSMGGGIFY